MSDSLVNGVPAFGFRFLLWKLMRKGRLFIGEYVGDSWLFVSDTLTTALRSPPMMVVCWILWDLCRWKTTSQAGGPNGLVLLTAMRSPSLPARLLWGTRTFSFSDSLRLRSRLIVLSSLLRLSTSTRKFLCISAKAKSLLLGGLDFFFKGSVDVVADYFEL